MPGRTYAKDMENRSRGCSFVFIDTDIDENSDEDRMITSQLYGGDWENRFNKNYY